jgi:hypothetical protein
MKKSNTSKLLDKCIIAILGKPSNMIELPEEPTIIQMVGELSQYIVNHRKTLLIIVSTIIAIKLSLLFLFN